MKYRFAAEIPTDLAKEIQATVERVRGSEEPGEYAKDGADLILRLTKACLDAYFLHPVRALEVGFVAQKATAVGVTAAHRAISLFVHRITASLSDEQVLKLADILEGMLVISRGGATT